MFVPKLTAPLRANARPSIVALSTRVMLVSATILPLNVVPVPSVAELPTCHQTFRAWAPPLNAMFALFNRYEQPFASAIREKCLSSEKI